MTNEENINNIVSEVVIFGNEVSVDALIYALSLLARRKDQQFKEHLEKKIEPFIRTNASPQGTYQEGFDDGYISAINEIIDKLFGED